MPEIPEFEEPCPQPCDCDCESGSEHCINLHLPRHKWTHPPEACETIRRLDADLKWLNEVREIARREMG